MRAGFVFSSVLTGIRRNVTMAIALILSTAIALAFVGAAILADKEISRFKSTYEGKLSVSVFLCSSGDTSVGHCTTRPVLGANGKQQVIDGLAATDSTTTAAQNRAVVAKLAADPNIASYSYVSEAEQVARVKRTLPENQAKNLNVGDLPASYTVKLKDIKNDYVAFQRAYSVMPGVSATTNADEVLNRLLDIIDGVRLFALVIAIVVLIASILLIANTIQVAAAQRRNETSIMRLVGASRWMTELPFLLEAVLAAFLGGLIAAAMVWFGKTFVLNNIFKLQVESGVIPNLNANDLLLACGYSLGAGIVVSGLTAFLTLRLYVKL